MESEQRSRLAEGLDNHVGGATKPGEHAEGRCDRIGIEADDGEGVDAAEDEARRKGDRHSRPDLPAIDEKGTDDRRRHTCH